MSRESCKGQPPTTRQAVLRLRFQSAVRQTIRIGCIATATGEVDCCCRDLSIDDIAATATATAIQTAVTSFPFRANQHKRLNGMGIMWKQMQITKKFV